VFGLVDAREEALAPTFKSPQDRVTGGKCASSGQQILERVASARVERRLQLVEHVIGKPEFAPGYAAEDGADLVILPEPVQGGPRFTSGCQSLIEGSQSGSTAVCVVAEQDAESAVEDTAGAHAALVQEIFDAADGAYVGRGLASALGADRLIDARVTAEPAQLPATRAALPGCERTCVATVADRAFVPVSHGLPRLAAVRAYLGCDRAANDAEHLALALPAARSDVAAPFALHDRALPADATEIRVPSASEPHNCAHPATPTTGSTWPSVAVRAARPTIAIAAYGRGAARPAWGWLDRATAGTQRRAVLPERHGSVQAA
jgi:hypothetical protein